MATPMAHCLARIRLCLAHNRHVRFSFPSVTLEACSLESKDKRLMKLKQTFSRCLCLVHARNHSRMRVLTPGKPIEFKILHAFSLSVYICRYCVKIQTKITSSFVGNNFAGRGQSSQMHQTRHCYYLNRVGETAWP